MNREREFDRQQSLVLMTVTLQKVAQVTISKEKQLSALIVAIALDLIARSYLSKSGIDGKSTYPDIIASKASAGADGNEFA